MDAKTPKTPFFARFLQTGTPTVKSGLRAGASGTTGWLYDADEPPPTKKYPSDTDEQRF